MIEANFEALLRACENAETETQTDPEVGIVSAEARVLGQRVRAVLDAQGLASDPASCERAAHLALNQAAPGSMRARRAPAWPSLWDLGGRSMLWAAALMGGSTGMNELAHLAETQGWLLSQHLVFFLALVSCAGAQFHAIKAVLQFPHWVTCAVLRLVENPSPFATTGSTGPR